MSEHPWTKGHLRLDQTVIDTVHREAVAAYARDEECCGLVSGPASDAMRCTTAIPFVNRQNKLHALDPVAYPRTGRMAFDIDPLKVMRAVEDGAARGEPVKVLYHSHLDVGAYFSDTDATAATMGGPTPAYDVAYLVVSVRSGVVDDTKLFAWEQGTFVETPFSIAEAGVSRDS